MKEIAFYLTLFSDFGVVIVSMIGMLYCERLLLEKYEVGKFFAGVLFVTTCHADITYLIDKIMPTYIIAIESLTYLICYALTIQDLLQHDNNRIVGFAKLSLYIFVPTFFLNLLAH